MAKINPNKKYVVHYVGGKPETVYIFDEELKQAKIYGYWTVDPDNPKKRSMVKPKAWPKLLDSVDKLIETHKLDKKYVKVMDEGDFFLSML